MSVLKSVRIAALISALKGALRTNEKRVLLQNGRGSEENQNYFWETILQTLVHMPELTPYILATTLFAKT